MGGMRGVHIVPDASPCGGRRCRLKKSENIYKYALYINFF
jgi:hypothetical protein